MLFIYPFPSPFGCLRLVGDEVGLTHLLFAGQSAPENASDGETSVLRLAAQELEGYFSGKLDTFTVPLFPRGTPFQQAVWAALRTIPYGHTASYKDIAMKIGKPAAVRAAGQANGKNRIPIFIPCHRVIAADGALGGYSLGLDVKRQLLKLERQESRTAG